MRLLKILSKARSSMESVNEVYFGLLFSVNWFEIILFIRITLSSKQFCRLREKSMCVNSLNWFGMFQQTWLIRLLCTTTQLDWPIEKKIMKEEYVYYINKTIFIDIGSSDFTFAAVHAKEIKKKSFTWTVSNEEKSPLISIHSWTKKVACNKETDK